MSENVLEAVITADPEGFKKAVQEADKQSQAFANNSQKNFGKAAKAVEKGSNSSAYALTNLGRVFSDAPFGFIAIQNNIDPLVQSFTSLKNQTGSTKSALLALGQSLTGPAGIALGITAVTAGLTYLSAHPDALDFFKDMSSSSYLAAQSLKQFNTIVGDTTASVQGQLANVSSLIRVYQDESQAQSTRKNALEELQRLYPEELKNLNLQNSASKATAASISKLTEALVLRAEAQGLQNAIADEAAKKAKIQNQSIDEAAGAYGFLVEQLGKINPALAAAGTALKTTKAVKNITEQSAEASSNVAFLTKKLGELNLELAKGDQFKPDSGKKPIIDKTSALFDSTLR